MERERGGGAPEKVFALKSWMAVICCVREREELP